MRRAGLPRFFASGGRVYWIQDAYTVASTFPYAEPFQGKFNYIRNSVKVVVARFHAKDDSSLVARIRRIAGWPGASSFPVAVMDQGHPMNIAVEGTEVYVPR